MRAAAWPLIRHDLGLDYADIGLALSLPALVGLALEPLIGLAGDGPRRRTLLLGGGIVFAGAVALSGLAPGLAVLLVALTVLYPATTAFVSLAQAGLMDVQPERRERNMAWWTLAGSVGVVAGPLLLAVAVASGLGWRALTVATGIAALPLVAAARWAPLGSEDGEPLRAAARSALAALRRRDVLRWLAVLESSDLMLDVLHGFLALYLVDVAGARPRDAGLALAVWTGAGLAGDLLLIPVLGRVAGVRYLRLSAAAVAFVYPEFLLVDGLGAKLALLAMLGLLNSGWYAIPKAGLYAAMPGRSGAAIAIGTAGGLVGALIPLTLGLVAERAGLAPTMWLLAAAPVLLLVLLPRDRAGRL